MKLFVFISSILIRFVLLTMKQTCVTHMLFNIFLLFGINELKKNNKRSK